MTAPSDWPGPPVQVIGMGMATGALGHAARMALEQAELIIGAAAHLAVFPDLTPEKRLYPSPMSGLWNLLRANAGRRIALLASGDPLFFGIGSTLLRYLPPEHLVFHPNVSSIQAAFARLGRPWQHAQLVSLHGRPLASLRAALQDNRLYALLTDRDSSPTAIARMLIETGFGESDLWVAEELGAMNERFRQFRAAELADADTEFSPLNVVILETSGPGGILPEFPGIPDEWFSTGAEPGKGLLSKREVRLTILSLLAPRAGEIGWDVGAGCGGVSVEWARWNPHGEVHAVECHPERLEHLGLNRERFGVVANLRIVAGRAPEALAELPDPQAVFIGGSSGSLPEMLDVVWARLQPGGRLVASAVTEDSRVELHGFVGDRAAEWTELSIARGERLAGQRVMRPYLPVLLMKLEKPAGGICPLETSNHPGASRHPSLSKEGNTRDLPLSDSLLAGERSERSSGTLYGVGVGPGDPELLTLKAVRILQSVPVVAYPATPQGSAQARDIAAQWLTGKREIPIAMPCMLDRGPVNQGYDEAAAAIATELAAGHDVAILCEGDPLFYGSFSYLLQRLGDRFPCVVIPGINSVSAAGAAATIPLITGEQRLTVIPATAGDEALRQALLDSDSVAILKPGRHRPRLLELLRETGRAGDTLYIEQASRPAERVVKRFDEIPATPGPYFALFLVIRAGQT